MEYNSQREELTIPEYGRHVQKLIDYCKTLEKEEERQALAELIVRLMMQMNPQSRNMEDYQDKLWKHFFRIADYDIQVTPPNGETPGKPDKEVKPDQLHYPGSQAKFRHYGHLVQQLIDKAMAMEDSTKKTEFTQVIAAYMKLAYKTWNKEHYVSDETIKSDLKAISDGQLVLAEETQIDNLSQSSNNSNKRRKSGQRGKNGGRGGKNYSKGRRRKN